MSLVACSHLRRIAGESAVNRAVKVDTESGSVINPEFADASSYGSNISCKSKREAVQMRVRHRRSRWSAWVRTLLWVLQTTMSIFASNGSIPGHSLIGCVDGLAAYDRAQNFGGEHIVRRNGRDVAIEDDKVREKAGFETSLAVFAELREG